MKLFMRLLLGMGFLGAITYEKPTGKLETAKLIRTSEASSLSFNSTKKRGHLLYKR